MWQLMIYLTLRAARRDANANLKCFLGSRDTSNLMLMVSFTFTMRRQLIRLTAAPFASCHLAKFGWLSFAMCNVWQRSRMQNLHRVGETPGPTLTRLWTKVQEIYR